MKELPITILMPAYNAEKYIGEAIESILSQSFKNFEFIIVDDASTDNTRKVIHKYAQKDKRIIVLKNKNNLKICKTLNKGINIAKGKYTVRVDADDWSFPDRIKKQFDFMESHKKLVISGGTMVICDAKLKPYAVRTYASDNITLRKSLMRFSPFSHPTIIFKTAVAKKIGGYNQLYAEDIEFYIKMGRYGEFGNLKDQLIKYRELPSSMTSKNLRVTEVNTIHHRIKAVLESRYSFTLLDLIYNIVQLISIFIFSAKTKIYLFNKFRNKAYEKKL